MHIKLQFMVPALAGAMFLLAGCGDPLNNGGNNGGGNGGGGGTQPVVTPEITIPSTEDLAPAIAAEGGSATVSFKSAADWTVSVSTTKAGEWISVSPTSGKAGDAKITITVAKNEDSEVREATVTIKSGTVSKEVKVSQAAGKLKDEAWYATNYWRRTDREKLGLRGPVKTYSHTLYTRYKELEFDQDGHLLNERYIDTEDPAENNVWVHSYDSKGRLVSRGYKYTYDNYADVHYSYEYEYGNEGKLVAAEWFWSVEQLDATIYHLADLPNGFNGRYMFMWDLSRIKETDFGFEFVYCTDTDFVFGTDGNLTITETSYNIYPDVYAKDGRGGARVGDAEVRTYQVEYQGDLPCKVSSMYPEGYYRSITWQANGMPATFYSKLPPGAYDWYGDQVIEASWLENGRYLSLEHYKVPQGYAGAYAPEVLADNTFNEMGDVVEKVRMNGDSYSPDGAIYHDTWTDYVYDKYGNWTSRKAHGTTTLTAQEYTNDEKRTINYF